MTVKELITRLLDEDPNEEIAVTIDADDKAGMSGFLFQIKEVKHWNYMALIYPDDWLSKDSIPIEWIEDYSKCQNIQANEQMIIDWRMDRKQNETDNNH